MMRLTELELVAARAAVLRSGIENLPAGIFGERLIAPQRLFRAGCG